MEFSPTPIDGTDAHDPDFDAFDPTPCQLCGSAPSQRNDYMWVTSFVVLTRHAEYSARLCRDCATRQGLKEMAKSAFLGWWGFPWGLMTVKALWVNGRSLARWSRIPSFAAVVLMLVALAAPFAVVGGLVWMTTPAEERAARQTGDWVDQEVQQEVEAGHHRFAEDDAAGALEHYLRAQAEAPRSRVTNFSVAQAYAELGRFEDARSYAAEAERLAPDNPSSMALHGRILSAIGRDGEARKRVESLRGVEPPDDVAAVEMAVFFEATGETEELLRVLNAPLMADDSDFQTRRLYTLVDLDRFDEAGTVAGGLPDGVVDGELRRFCLDLQGLSADPASALDRVLATWRDRGYGERAMGRLVAAAESSGQGETVHRRVEAFLLDPATPQDAWGAAHPWFDDDAWVRILDRRLAHGLEAEPAYARLGTFDPMTESRELVALADRVRRLDHPLAEAAEIYYFTVDRSAKSEADVVAALEAHLASDEAAEHVYCRLQLATLLARSQPARSLELLDELVRRSPDDAALVEERRALLAETRLFDDPGGALDELRALHPNSPDSYTPAFAIDLLAAEAALYAGDDAELERRLRRLLDGDEVGVHSAALVLRWSHQLAAGEPVTYRADVDDFLARRGEAVHRETATSTQAILIAEGLDRHRWILAERQSTVSLVAALRAAERTGGGDLTALRDIAATAPPHAFAPELARYILVRRGGGG